MDIYFKGKVTLDELVIYDLPHIIVEHCDESNTIITVLILSYIHQILLKYYIGWHPFEMDIS